MAIKSLEIKNYKSITNLNFIPAKINLIIGKNNTGKTSVLGAIDLLFNNDNVRTPNMNSYFNIYSNDETITIYALIDNNSKKLTVRKVTEVEIIKEFSKEIVNNFLKGLANNEKKIDINKLELVKDLETFIEKSISEELRDILITNSLATINEKNEKQIHFGLFNMNSLEKVESLTNNLADYVGNKFALSNQKESLSLIKNASRNALFSFTGIMRKIPYISSEKNNLIYIKSLRDNIGRYSFSPRNPKDSERLHKVEKMVKDLKLIKNLEKLDFDNVLFLTDKGIKGHSFDFLGDGFKSIVGLIWHLSSEKVNNKIVLLDEPENHLHPGYIEELLNFIIEFSKRLNIQFFITTHSQDVLEILLTGNLENEKQQYIEKELQILKMSKIRESIVLTECLNYLQAKEIKDELSLDLRGI